MTSGNFTLRQMKADHLKKRADEALKKGNYRDAIEKYSECLSVKPEKAGNEVIYSNRSLANNKAGRYEAAVNDADEAIRTKPTWVKGYWRKASALKNLRKVLDALYALEKACEIEPDNKEIAKEIWKYVQSATREQICEWCINKWNEMEDCEDIQSPAIETVSHEEMVEAYFRHIYTSHINEKKIGPYYHKIYKWITNGLSKATAYVERSSMYRKAKCYLQAQHDAKLAIASLEKEIFEKECEEDVYIDLAYAYFELGSAYIAEKDHLDRDEVQAAKAFSKAVDLEPSNDKYQGKLKEIGEELNPAQMTMVMNELYNKSHSKLGLHHPLSLGIVEEPLSGQKIYRVDCIVTFSKAKPKDFNSHAREIFRKAVCKYSNVDLQKVMIDRVAMNSRSMFSLEFQIQVGSDFAKAELIFNAMAKPEDAMALIGGNDIVACMGEVKEDGFFAKIEDVTPDSQDIPSEEVPQSEYAPLLQSESDAAIVIPSRPKTDIELPYKLYKLVYNNGTKIERHDKHGFCMSRCYYSKTELPEEIWVEICDGSCRWRQSSDEIKLMLLNVPCDISAKMLNVVIEPYHIKVENKNSKCIYFEGDLERGIIPEQSLWEHGRGLNEEGFMIYLKKMNLELLSKPFQHAEMWWPKLCKHHGEIAWDDYEKDYSDLPEPIKQQYTAQEQQGKLVSNLEHMERMKREALQESDDLRKRTRQERLHELRTGESRSWVELNRANPPKPLMQMPQNV